MKLIEKLVLCCIWICIAIVGVLIKDQMTLNEKIRENQIKLESADEKSEDVPDSILMDETKILELVSTQIPEASLAVLNFNEDSIEVKVQIDDELIEQVRQISNFQLVEAALVMMKGTEFGCEVTFVQKDLELKSCSAGFFSVPEEVLNMIEERLNQVWRTVAESQKIESVEIEPDGLSVIVQQE